MGSWGPRQSGPVRSAGLSSPLAGKERAVLSSRAWMWRYHCAVHAAHLSVPGSSVGPGVLSTLIGPVHCWCLMCCWRVGTSLSHPSNN